MAAAQPPWPPPGSPQYAGVRDAWRDATLAEWFLHHPQGKALFRIWAAMQRARWQSPPSGAGAAGGAPRTAPAGAPPRPAPPARSGARAPDAARAGPSAPSPSEAQRRRQRRERARAAAVAAAAAGQAGGGTAASDPAAAVRGAASAGGGPEPARPSSAHAPTQATAATTHREERLLRVAVKRSIATARREAEIRRREAQQLSTVKALSQIPSCEERALRHSARRSSSRAIPCGRTRSGAWLVVSLGGSSTTASRSRPPRWTSSGERCRRSCCGSSSRRRSRCCCSGRRGFARDGSNRAVRCAIPATEA